MEQMSKYVRLTRTLFEPGILVKPEEIHKHIKDQTIDHYQGTYLFDEINFNEFQKTGSVKGTKDLKANKLWFDFDSSDLKLARNDTITLVERLKSHVAAENLEIFFSGNKGFNVIVNLKKELTRKQVENVTKKFAGDLQTFDTTLYDYVQLLRIPGTKHQKSGLYKIPLTFEELQNLKRDELLEKAKKPLSLKEAQPQVPFIDLDENLFETPEVDAKVKTNVLKELDLNSKPRQWKASKWALMQGFFGPGERDQSSMILAATCRGMGYDAETTYYMCKSALKKSWERNGQGDFTKEDLWKKIEQVFSESWKGGQYSEKDDAFLQKKSDELGLKELTTGTTVDIKGALKLFEGYAKNIDQLTLKTGIEELDRKQRITVGMSWGIIAAPGSGKTSIALQIIHSMSKNGELCIFFSYDMFAPHVIQKIIQKHWPDKEDIEFVLTQYKDGNKEYVKRVEELIMTEYPNVEFCFESGQTVDDIKDTIRDAEHKRGKKCRFVVIDYNELVISDVSDPTQSSNKTAQQMRSLASNDQICVLSLFQPNKHSGDPSAEIKSYLNAKGGGGIGQSVSFMLGVSRPGYDPRNAQGDKYISLNVVKNRMGPIFYVDLHWNGYKGQVRTLNSTERSELASLRKAKEDEKNGAIEEW